MDNVKEYVEQFVTFGNPVEYKGLKIKPILAKDALRFLSAVSVLQIEKNKIPSVEIIQMSYLEFMINFMVAYNEYMLDFLCLMNLIFDLEYDEQKRIEGFKPNEILIEELPNKEVIYRVNGWNFELKLCHPRGAEMILNGIKLNSREFDNLRRIILYQNLYEYDETPMSDDFKRVIEQYYTIRNRGIHMPTFEDKVVAVILNTSYTLKSIQYIPYRMFEKIFYDGISKFDYIASKSLEPHLKEGKSIDHWIYKPIRDKYSEVFSDANEFANKIASM